MHNTRSYEEIMASSRERRERTRLLIEQSRRIVQATNELRATLQDLRQDTLATAQQEHRHRHRLLVWLEKRNWTKRGK